MQSPGKSRYATAPQEAVNSAQGGRLPPPKAIRKADRTRVSLRPAREREADPPSRIGLKQDQPVKIDPAWQIGTLGQLRAAVPKPQAEGFQLIPLGLYKPLGPIALREESSRPVRLCWTSARKIRAMRCFFGPSVRKRLRIGERAKARRGLGGQPQSRKPNRLETWLARTGRHFQSPWRERSVPPLLRSRATGLQERLGEGAHCIIFGTKAIVAPCAGEGEGAGKPGFGLQPPGLVFSCLCPPPYLVKSHVRRHWIIILYKCGKERKDISPKRRMTCFSIKRFFFL